ncbi:MAG TPA: GIY-YIG nuclease family protein [Longimicrobium sp.]|nr:GIY-YIG nuclease family protein [Longimicrobium sp.]
MEHNYYVYILASAHGVLYVGVTNDLVRRVSQHKQRLVPGFTRRYNVDRLVYYEHAHDVSAAIAREKQIKGWVREKKVALVEAVNLAWADLYPTIAPGLDDAGGRFPPGVGEQDEAVSRPEGRP